MNLVLLWGTFKTLFTAHVNSVAVVVFRLTKKKNGRRVAKGKKEKRKLIFERPVEKKRKGKESNKNNETNTLFIECMYVSTLLFVELGTFITCAIVRYIIC